MGARFCNLAPGGAPPAAPSLPPLSPELLQLYSNPVPGQVRRLVAMTFTDWPQQSQQQSQQQSHQQQTQAALAANWVRSAARANLSCLVGVCEAAAPPAALLAPLCVPPGAAVSAPPGSADSFGGCGLFHALNSACVANPRLGRWFYAAEVLQAGFDLLSSDPDVAFARPPLPYLGALLAAHPAADVLATRRAGRGGVTSRVERGRRAVARHHPPAAVAP